MLERMRMQYMLKLGHASMMCLRAEMLGCYIEADYWASRCDVYNEILDAIEYYR